MYLLISSVHWMHEGYSLLSFEEKDLAKAEFLHYLAQTYKTRTQRQKELHQFSFSPTRYFHITDCDVLSAGLYHTGFDKLRKTVNLETNICRFKASCGIQPNGVCMMFSDMRDNYPAPNLKDVFMIMNGLSSITLGGYSEPVIAKRLKLQLQS